MTKESTIKIGIIGKIRSGKDTVADLLEIELAGTTDKEVLKTHFSRGIEKVIVDYFGAKAFKNGKPRKMYQEIGQLFRKFDNDVWINKLIKDVKHFDGHVIVKDVRQPNEALTLRDEGYTLIKVSAPEQVRLERSLASGDDFKLEDLQHETELAVDKCVYDYELINDGSILDLQLKTHELLELIKQVSN